MSGCSVSSGCSSVSGCSVSSDCSSVSGCSVSSDSLFSPARLPASPDVHDPSDPVLPYLHIFHLLSLMPIPFFCLCNHIRLHIYRHPTNQNSRSQQCRKSFFHPSFHKLKLLLHLYRYVTLPFLYYNRNTTIFNCLRNHFYHVSADYLPVHTSKYFSSPPRGAHPARRAFSFIGRNFL